MHQNSTFNYVAPTSGKCSHAWQLLGAQGYVFAGGGAYQWLGKACHGGELTVVVVTNKASFRVPTAAKMQVVGDSG